MELFHAFVQYSIILGLVILMSYNDIKPKWRLVASVTLSGSMKRGTLYHSGLNKLIRVIYSCYLYVMWCHFCFYTDINQKWRDLISQTGSRNGRFAWGIVHSFYYVCDQFCCLLLPVMPFMLISLCAVHCAWTNIITLNWIYQKHGR